MSAVPLGTNEGARSGARDSGPVLQATDLHRHYSVSRGLLRGHANLKAVAGASFTLTRWLPICKIRFVSRAAEIISGPSVYRWIIGFSQ